MTRRPKLGTETIAHDLLPLVVPIGWLEELPGNPRRGRVDAIRRSVEAFGQRKPIVVRKTGEVDGHPVGYVSAGNHTLRALRDMGWQWVAVIWVDETEEESFAWSLADNRSHDLGAYDPDDLSKVIARLGDRPDLLAAAFDAAAIARLNDTPRGDGLSTPDLGAGAVGSAGLGLTPPVASTVIVFDNDDQQANWFRFVAFLRVEYAACDTLGERLACYIADHIAILNNP